MTAIVTITINPALDVWTSTDQVVDSHKLRCGPAQVHPGGGGVNVARVLHRLDSPCVAWLPLGGVTGARLHALLAEEGVASHCAEIAGETRESFSVQEASSGREFRFVLPGPTLSEPEWQGALDWLESLQPAPRYVVGSGSLPPGVPDDFYARLARVVKARGSRFVLDTSGPPLHAALDEGVYLVKPSLRELSGLAGHALNTEQDWLDSARALVAAGRAEVVALSLGAQGALLVSADHTLRANALAVPVSSTIGAGDSFLAALVWALNRDAGPQEAFGQAMAAGAAALLAAGTALCQPADIRRLLADVRIDAMAGRLP